MNGLKHLATIMTQNEELVALLRERREAGVNSFETFRNNHRQLPRMIKDLEREGYIINHLRQKNTSVTYVLADFHQGEKYVPAFQEIKDSDGRVISYEMV